ncbi:thiamine-phosphate kinase [bacterium Unc6]|nr:thiamine-phosphate kinase [bacterium Unc6]
MQEFEMLSKIRNIFKTKDRNILVGIGDDAAVIGLDASEHLVFATDMIVEGIDFKIRNKNDAFLAGRKSLAINLSDIAAMSGIPLYCVVGVVLPDKYGWQILKKIAKGIKHIADQFDVQVVGGDLSSGKYLQITIAIIGKTKNKKFITRKGAKIADRILVTGSLGGSIKGRHLKFIPRLKEAQSLVKNFKINSMIDISDGLGSDIKRICEESKTGCRIYAKSIPLSKDAKDVHSALNDGEDFELLFTADQEQAKNIIKQAKDKIEVKITDIGEILPKSKGMYLEFEKGESIKIQAMGYEHFKN